jgi:hypothetical protein
MSLCYNLEIYMNPEQPQISDQDQPVVQPAMTEQNVTPITELQGPVKPKKSAYVVIGLVLAGLLVAGLAVWFVAGRGDSTELTNKNDVTTGATNASDTSVVSDKLVLPCYSIQIPAQRYAEPALPEPLDSNCVVGIYTYADDFSDFKVSALAETPAEVISAAKEGGTDLTETTIDVDGQQATKYISQGAQGLDTVAVIVGPPEEYSVGGRTFRSFFIYGYYYNDEFRKSFDDILASWQWQ